MRGVPNLLAVDYNAHGTRVLLTPINPMFTNLISPGVRDAVDLTGYVIDYVSTLGIRTQGQLHIKKAGLLTSMGGP